MEIAAGGFPSSGAGTGPTVAPASCGSLRDARTDDLESVSGTDLRPLGEFDLSRLSVLPGQPPLRGRHPDLLWSTNAPEYYALMVTRGWTPDVYAERLADLWIRLLLARP